MADFISRRRSFVSADKLKFCLKIRPNLGAFDFGWRLKPASLRENVVKVVGQAVAVSAKISLAPH